MQDAAAGTLAIIEPPARQGPQGARVWLWDVLILFVVAAWTQSGYQGSEIMAAPQPIDHENYCEELGIEAAAVKPTS